MKSSETSIPQNKQSPVPCRFSEEDAALLLSVGIAPTDDVPDEVLQMVKLGCPVFNDEPDFLKSELH